LGPSTKRQLTGIVAQLSVLTPALDLAKAAVAPLQSPSSAFWSWQLVVAALLNIVLQAFTIGAYAARLAGVQMLRIATSISLFNLVVTASRLANMFYSPMLGSISDKANALAQHGPAYQALAVHQYDLQLRIILLAGTVGTIVGALMLPTFLLLFRRGIGTFERLGSVPRALLRFGSVGVLFDVGRSIRPPQPSQWSRFRLSHVPVKLIVANIIVTAIYLVGVVAAAYASLLDPQSARTALLASGLVNGIATIAFSLIVDPTSAFITDQAARGERSVEEVKSLVFYLSLSAIIGTLLSQLILFPAAAFIGWGAGLVNR
jgi:hypothetical protein